MRDKAGRQHPPGPAQLADRIAAAVAACPLVAGLADGPVATYLPGRIVPGVAVREHLVVIAVVVRYGPLADAARQVHAAASRVAPGFAVEVRIEDLQLPGDSQLADTRERGVQGPS
ncbi:MAG: hypothetical protein WBH47_14955 [Streptosporangiaceae bacterium]